MKKIVSIIVLILVVTFSAQAQKDGKKVSPEKQVERSLKKMTKDLDLSDAQQNDIKPLLVSQIADRNEMMLQREKLKNTNEKPSKEQRREMRTAALAKEEAMHTKMKSILTSEQFTKFLELKEAQKNKQKLRRQ